MFRKIFQSGVVVLSFFLIDGCAGSTNRQHQKDAGQNHSPATVSGGIHQSGAEDFQQPGPETLTRNFVKAHHLATKETPKAEGSPQKNRESTQQKIEEAQKALGEIEALATRQGTGEITLFFPENSSEIPVGGFEYQRLVRFVDSLARSSVGRKILFISIGSASRFGSEKTNKLLALERSEAPLAIIDKYLVNLPHAFTKVYGTSDLYSPGNVPVTIHRRYQHTRVIAFYEDDFPPEKAQTSPPSKKKHDSPSKDEGATVSPARPPDNLFTNSLGMTFVYIHPGTFEKGFYLQTTEVTRQQWKFLMENDPSYFQGCGDQCPVEQVSWFDVREFIRRLNQSEETERYRLPTEAEWEYACRAGTTTSFFYGDYESGLGDYAWYLYNAGSQSHPVGQMKANAWGLYDMHGNVWEWCQDSPESPSSKSTTDDPALISHEATFIARGGGWYDPPSEVHSNARSVFPAQSRYRNLGFRVVRNF